MAATSIAEPFAAREGTGPVAEPTLSPPDASREPRRRRAGRIGRKAAIFVYLLSVGYMSFVGFHAVIRGVYFPREAKAAELAGPLDPEACVREALTLRTEALERAALKVRTASGDSLDAFFAEWDARFKTLAHRCKDSLPDDLERLRYGLETMLARFDHAEGLRARRILEELGRDGEQNDRNEPQ
jgi:hypothetical protein